MVDTELIFNIHGDNIVECERALNYILKSVSQNNPVLEGPNGSILCPTFLIKIAELNLKLKITFYPGFGRWKKDILSLIREMGGLLRETPDVIITRIEDHREIPIIAIEFCGALPAGNQAWQRSGRAYSYGQAGIPYFYIAELGGFELNNEREKKAERSPNPAVPFSYITYSKECNISTLPVFNASFGSTPSSQQIYREIFGGQEFLNLLKSIILNEKYDISKQILEEKALDLVCILAESRRNRDTLNSKEWRSAYHSISEKSSLIDFLVKTPPISWSKTAYIAALTPTASNLMKLGSKYGIGLTSSSLPMCVIPGSNRNEFSKKVRECYPHISPSFFDWLSKRENLAICWVMGFKPRHDDARPDRGLPPLCRMLSGQKTDVLTIVYGPAPPTHWLMLEKDPAELMRINGLWESILVSSDAILVDSETLGRGKEKGYTKQHWEKELSIHEIGSILVPAMPLRLGEHDIDTILHLLFNYFGQPHVFEGMCNPPGGDWSGISIITKDRQKTLRWLSLPRVSGKHAKRPDHVFEIFSQTEDPILLIVESKETASKIEKDIGTRLIEYVRDLLNSIPSAESKNNEGKWIHSSHTVDQSQFQMASAVAFFIQSDSDFRKLQVTTNVDIICGFSFNEKTGTCRIYCQPQTHLGQKVFSRMEEFQKRGFGVELKLI